MPETKSLTRREAIDFLDIPEKDFENYHKFSKEIVGEQIRRRWYFNKSDLATWKELKEDRTIDLSIEEYEKSFEFAIKMVYG